jgi:hypothetical protein
MAGYCRRGFLNLDRRLRFTYIALGENYGHLENWGVSLSARLAASRRIWVSITLSFAKRARLPLAGN